MKQHYWDAPPVPPGTPQTATIVIRSRCGLTRPMPVWQMHTWASTAPATVDPAAACDHCVAVTP